MIKSHSMGVGDLLRSSAAWRALKNKWPNVELHLLFLSKHQGYSTEALIQKHHLLSSAHFVTVRTHNPAIRNAKRIPIKNIITQVQSICRSLQPDLIIDFEPNGLKTSLITWIAGITCSAKTLGIAQFPGRSWFYNLTSPSLITYAQNYGLSLPMDYTLRDFVVLQALGIERNQIQIELTLTPEADKFKRNLLARLPSDLPVVGLNIGCGTEGALLKRPDLNQLAHYMSVLYAAMPYTLLLSGAPFEKDVNQSFIQALSSQSYVPKTIIDLAGKTSLITSVGLIDACNIFISTDSGPYHMAVGLKKPCLVWFTYPEVTSFHKEAWVGSLIQPTVEEFIKSALHLARIKY